MDRDRGMKIIIVTPELVQGGVERVLNILANAWCKMGIQITIVQIAVSQYRESYQLDSNIKLISVNDESSNRYIRIIKSVKQLISILNRNRKATVLSFRNETTLRLALCRPFVDNRIVFSERNDPRKLPVNKLTRWLRNRAFCIADACVFQTHDAMMLFPKKAQQKGTVILNPVNPDMPIPWEGERRKVIVTACRLTKQKNLPMLLEAFAEFNKNRNDFILEIYGRGEDEKKLKDLAQSLGIRDTVKFLGFANDLYEKMKDAFMYVSSSDYEGIPNSVLEAMAMGIPTISTDCPIGGPKEIIDGENGILIPVNNKDELTLAMCRIANDKKLAYSIGNNAKKVRCKYPVELIAKQWIDILF